MPNKTQERALELLERALPLLKEASKLSECVEFEQETSKGNGHPISCRIQDALYHAQQAIDGLRHGVIDPVRASYV